MKDLSSHIMDIVQNSIRAAASWITIRIVEDPDTDLFSIEIRDNGTGMDASTLEKVRDPFFTSRTVRKVGLGIPLLQQNTERTGGRLLIMSHPGTGTTVTALFVHSHLDRPPLGDIAGTLTLLAAANPSIRFSYEHTTPAGEYCFDSLEIADILEGVPIDHPDILSALQDMIRENLKEIHADQNIQVKHL